MKHKLYNLIALSMLCSISSFGQVTIGSKKVPVSGALLDLKDNKESSVAGGITTTKGLGMPIVKLTDNQNLFPMFEASPGSNTPNGDYNTSTKKEAEDEKHIGLVVYNPDECSLQGKGMYVWEEDGWNKLDTDKTSIGLNVSATNLKLYNSLPTKLNITWAPATLAAPTMTSTGLDFNIDPDPLVSSPTYAILQAKGMSDAEIQANPFMRKDGTLTFSLLNSPCVPAGVTQTKTIHVLQVNKALLVDGTDSPQPMVVSNYFWQEQGFSLDVKSNARWMMTLKPVTDKSVISNFLGKIMGTEDESGDASRAESNTVNFRVNQVERKNRVTFVLFRDYHSPQRFKDVAVTLYNCKSEREFTMSEYRDMWEDMYGLNLDLEPDSNGNEAINTNKVQWHYDHSKKTKDGKNRGNIFFSAMFGNKRWMTTNMAAKVFDTDIIDRPQPITNKFYYYENDITIPKWAYLSVANHWDAADTDTYNKMERHGVLYNWTMATAAGTTQGICPNGWHLPTVSEYEDLFNEIDANVTKYAYPRTDTSPSSMHQRMSYLISNPCDGYRLSLIQNGKGMSKSFLQGGFDFVISAGSGYLNSEITQNVSYLVTSEFRYVSQSNGGVKWKAYQLSGGGLGITENTIGTLLPVRCVKND